MTHTQQWLIEQLYSLKAKFPHISIKYGMEDIINCHLIILGPQKEYDYNYDLDNYWIPIHIQFISQFDEEIAFDGPDSSLSASKLLLEL